MESTSSKEDLDPNEREIREIFQEKEPFQGGDLFPERRGGEVARNWFKIIMYGANRETTQRIVCERRVHNLIAESPLIKLMLEALKSSGCPVDLNRHVFCEPCGSTVTGGYDAEMNQVVICQNNATSKSSVHGSLAHEMVHMFDYCRAHLDFRNLDHLLCSEIRAANLMHCSFLSAVFTSTASLMRIKRQHQECVKKKALSSVKAVRDESQEEIDAAMDRVFLKCYNDLEPLGRRLKRNSNDFNRVYRDRYLFGYGNM